MATATGKALYATHDKDRSVVGCEGCLEVFYYIHLTDHCQELSEQLDEIEVNPDLFRETNDRHKHFLIKQIDKWEKDSIQKIRQTAEECRQILLQHTNEHFNQIEINLVKLTDHLRETCQENDFNEIEINQLKQNLTPLEKELDKSSNISIQQDSASFINKISVVVSSGKCINYI